MCIYTTCVTIDACPKLQCVRMPHENPILGITYKACMFSKNSRNVQNTCQQFCLGDSKCLVFLVYANMWVYVLVRYVAGYLKNVLQADEKLLGTSKLSESGLHLVVSGEVFFGFIIFFHGYFKCCILSSLTSPCIWIM